MASKVLTTPDIVVGFTTPQLALKSNLLARYGMGKIHFLLVSDTTKVMMGQ